jgi:4'-phosphopantetheinyl transferase
VTIPSAAKALAQRWLSIAANNAQRVSFRGQTDPSAIRSTMPSLCLPEDYSLPEDEVHIWQANLESSWNMTERLRGILSIEEQQRADRFHFDHDRKRHTLARILLRQVAARVLNTSPERLNITSAPDGKPHLLLDASQPHIEFNISHSKDLIYVVVANGRAVGIDVEEMQSDFPVEMVARDAFSAVEFDGLMAVDPTLRLESFFTCWTRKEALHKAQGTGLTTEAASYGPSLFGDLPMPTQLSGIDKGVESRWTLLDLQAPRGYKAALVFGGADCRVKRWNWPMDGV